MMDMPSITTDGIVQTHGKLDFSFYFDKSTEGREAIVVCFNGKHSSAMEIVDGVINVSNLKHLMSVLMRHANY